MRAWITILCFGFIATTVTPLNPDVLAADTDGIVTAVDTGIATVLARNGDFQDSITIYVLDAPTTIFADGFEFGTTAGWSSTVP